MLSHRGDNKDGDSDRSKSQPRGGTLNPLAGKAAASSKDLSAATHALRGGISQVSSPVVVPVCR